MERAVFWVGAGATAIGAGTAAYGFLNILMYRGHEATGGEMYMYGGALALVGISLMFLSSSLNQKQ